jgi:hypothetical protein
MNGGLSRLEAFVAALARRDYAAMEAELSPRVHFRALIPPGVREATSAADARQHLQRWFSDADEFEMIENSVDEIGDRRHASYRIRLRENGVQYVVEQQIYADLDDDGITRLDLMCSGFRPTEAENAGH